MTCDVNLGVPDARAYQTKLMSQDINLGLSYRG
jgi:hypothetical protein